MDQQNNMYTVSNVTVFRNPKLIVAVDEDTGEFKMNLHPDYRDINAPSSNNLKKIQIQLLIDPNGNLERSACLYLHNRVKQNTRKHMKTEANALLLYFRYLASNRDENGQPLRWNVHPFQTSLKPVHRFKEWLIEMMKHGTPRTSTARTYLLAVIRFYKFTIRWGLFDSSERNAPFEFIWKKVAHKNSLDTEMLSHTHSHPDYEGHWGMTTDVMEGFPKNTKKTKRQKLRPMRKREQKLFLDNLHLRSERDRLMFELSFKAGLRATEVATFKANLVVDPATNQSVMVKIGPETRVETKYDKNREVEIHYELMRRLYLYKVSNERLRLVKKGVSDGNLFLTTKGMCMSGETLSKYFIRYATKLQLIDMDFAHQHHNLRSTFATNFLWGEVAKGRSLETVAEELMQLMGHENLSTTLEYVGFVKDELEKKRHQNVLSGVVDVAMAGK